MAYKALDSTRPIQHNAFVSCKAAHTMEICTTLSARKCHSAYGDEKRKVIVKPFQYNTMTTECRYELGESKDACVTVQVSLLQSVIA